MRWSCCDAQGLNRQDCARADAGNSHPSNGQQAINRELATVKVRGQGGCFFGFLSILKLQGLDRSVQRRKTFHQFANVSRAHNIVNFFYL